MSRVAVVVVRFGADIVGGAELHARMVATRMAARGHEVTVLTTCAEDYVTWNNVLPAGEQRDGGLRVLRFPVVAPRDMAGWEATMQPILRGCWDGDDEQRLLHAQGPDTPALLDHLRDHGGDYDALVFFTLLYLPTVLGLPLVRDRAGLVPTLHDEPAAHLLAQARAIRLARFVLWNTPEERELAERLYDVSGLPGAVTGVGVEPPARVDVAAARARFGLERPYLLYAGRIDPDKGCGELLDAFVTWAGYDDRADLVLAGRAWMDIPEHPRVRHVGFVSGDELWGLTAGALATVIPSRHESLSMVALESMACGVPILVPAGSPVLEGHVRRGRGGFVYRDGAELAAAASVLLDEPQAAAALGRDGRRYAQRNFSWARVDALYDEAVEVIRRTCSPRSG